MRGAEDVAVKANHEFHVRHAQHNVVEPANLQHTPYNFSAITTASALADPGGARHRRIRGAAGAVVIVLLRFLLSAYAILIGAEISGESERQTRKDTTSGREKPMGARRAHAVHTVGESQ